MFNKTLTDENALILLNEFAKVDGKALKLMALLQAAKEFGDRDQLLCQIHRYLQDNGGKK